MAALGGPSALAAPPVSDTDPATADAPPAEAPAADPAEASEAPPSPERPAAEPEPDAAEPEGPVDEGDDDGEDETDATADADDTALPAPPRVDGIYVGLTAYVPLSFARVRNLETPGVYVGPGGSFRAGEVVYPWMTIGVELTGELAYQSNQRLGQGAFLVDIGFLPVPKRPLSLHVGFGIGGGAIREDGVEGRKGYGGAAFKASARYEFFPFAKKRRPKRGGGFGLGPELGWLGFTPAKAGRPMSNTVYLGLTTTYYFGS